MNHLLQKLIDTIPIYQDIMQLDIAFSVSDTEKYIYLSNTDTMKFPFEVGTRIDEGGYEAVLNMIKETRQPFVNFVPREATGNVPIKAIVAPVFDEDELVGLFSISINMDKEEKIEGISGKLTESIGQVYSLVETITDAAKKMNEMMTSIGENILVASESIKEGTESIELIKGIADQSELLGINAAIVSAKAGEEGRSFSVVASEMRKLASESAQISDKVVKSLKGMEESVQEVLKNIENAKEIAQNQYNNTDNVKRSIKLISEQSNELVDQSKQQ